MPVAPGGRCVRACEQGISGTATHGLGSRLEQKQMGPSRRKLLKPVAVSTGVTSGRSLDAFVDYVRSECHLSDNTVAAYRRDLVKFFAWLDGRSVAKLTIRELADYASWLHAKKLAPASIARHVVSLKI